MNASAGGTHYGVHSTALKSGSFAGYFLGKVSIGTTTINNYSLPDSRGTANQVMQTDGSGNVSWVNSNTLLSASNGLSISGGDVILGGTLTQATTITQGTHSYYHNLNSSGDFFVQDAGVNVFEVSSNGNSYFGSDTYWKDVNTAGVTLAALIDDGDDGRFILYENGMASVDLDANSSFTFNEQGLDRDFRIEGDNNANLFYVDAGNDVVSFGRNNPTLTNNGATVNGVTLDYVADFELASGGTTVGLGSLEYVADVGSNLLAFSASLLPSANDTRDLGSAALRWDDVYATNGTIQTSDIRDKKNITEISYGLNELLALNPIRFQWKNSHDPKAKLGFSAQQIQKIIPEVVKEYDYVFPENGAAPIKKQNERLGVYYSDLIPVTVKAIQEQQEIIDSQQKTIQKLEKKQDETNALLKLLQQRIERLEGKN
jgi:hypothetical protein